MTLEELIPMVTDGHARATKAGPIGPKHRTYGHTQFSRTKVFTEK
jgi:hypothetical protein